MTPFGRRAYDALVGRVTGVWGWTISPITGDDGRPSWAKIITAYVVTIYIFAPQLPASVAITAIAAAHGTKMLLAWINRFNASVEPEPPNSPKPVLTREDAQRAADAYAGAAEPKRTDDESGP